MDARTRCLNASSTQLATVTPGTMNTTTWQQPLTVTATATGTCTFTLEDTQSALDHGGLGNGVPSQTVTVTIGS